MSQKEVEEADQEQDEVESSTTEPDSRFVLNSVLFGQFFICYLLSFLLLLLFFYVLAHILTNCTLYCYYYKREGCIKFDFSQRNSSIFLSCFWFF